MSSMLNALLLESIFLPGLLRRGTQKPNSELNVTDSDLTFTSLYIHKYLGDKKKQIKFNPLEVSTASSEIQMRAHLGDKYSSQWI